VSRPGSCLTGGQGTACRPRKILESMKTRTRWAKRRRAQAPAGGMLWNRTSQYFPISKKPKRDRRFESLPLHQRVSANRRSRSRFLVDGRFHHLARPTRTRAAAARRQLTKGRALQ
jgi:hypothetical protein